MMKKQKDDDTDLTDVPQDTGEPDLLETALAPSNTLEDEHQVKSIGKEVFNTKDIDVRSDITHNEINHITKLRFWESKFGTDVEHLVQSHLRLRLSKDRKSRGELVNIVQTEQRNAQGGIQWGKLFGQGGNNGQ